MTWVACAIAGAFLVGQSPQDAPPVAPPAERWLVTKSLQGTYYGSLLDDLGVRLYGWTEASFTASSVTDSQLPMGFNYRANEFLLQQNWLRVERPTNPRASEPTIGFRVDTILPGSDYRFTLARGLFDGQLPDTYGIDPVQFYAEAYVPQVGRGLLVKAGRFFAQYGYESIDTTQNQLASRSYAFIYDPFTHTGLLAQLQLDDAWSVQCGLVLGSDVFIDPAATPTYIGSFKWAPPNGRASVLFAVILGDPRFDAGESFNRPQVLDVVFTWKLDDRTTFALDALYGFQFDVPGIGFANWFGLVQYVTYQFDARLFGTARLELFDDAQGQRTGFEGLYTALTMGLNYRPRPDVILRPEVRYDYNEHSRPFEGKKGVFTAALDVLLRW